MLIGISSPYKKSGLLFRKFKKHFGQNDDDVLVIQAASRVLNPTLDQARIDSDIADDPAAARAEWLAEWRDDIAGWLPLELIEAAVDNGVTVRPPLDNPKIRYHAGIDPSRPLWQFQLVDNYNGGQAMVVRIHHCIADGIALIGVLLAMTSQDPIDDLVDAPDSTAPARGPTSDWEALLRPITDVTVKAIGTTGDVAGRVLHAYSAMLKDPESLGETAGEYARIAAQVAKDAAAIALMDNDSVTSLKGLPSGSKVVAWNEPLPLDDVKAVGKVLGCSSWVSAGGTGFSSAAGLTPTFVLESSR
jgi:hypothetical protein